LLIMAALAMLGARAIPLITVVLAAAWLVLAVAMRREYTRTLGRAIEGRFASVRGVFASIVDANTLPFVRQSLTDVSPLRVAFALELLDQLPDADITEFQRELHQLTLHDRPELRVGAWNHLSRVPSVIDCDRAHAALDDASPAVREAAARALLAAAGDAAPALLSELLRHPCTHVRSTALASNLRGAPHDDAATMLAPYLADPDPRVRSAALRSAGALRRADYCAVMIAALEDAGTRAAARDALALVGAPAVEPLARALLDTRMPARLRRAIPVALAEIPSQATVDAMLQLVLAPETDQLLDYRTLRALGRLRTRHRALVFDADVVHSVAQRECDAARTYSAVLRELRQASYERDVNSLLRRALQDGVRQRREGVFRCLGMLHDPEQVRRAHDAVTSSSATLRASALEWLEQIIGTYRFAQLRPVLEPRTLLIPPVTPETLTADGDAWIALLARAVTSPVESEMELIEKVFLLQQVDLLRGTRSAHVALLASVAEEVDVAADTVLIHAGRTTPALFVVIDGLVALSGVGEHLVLGAEEAFGAWGLIDEQPSPLEARSKQRTRLLRVSREDFQDLLADHPEVALGILQGVARRMRSLVA
jgi:HEAT repeat protein